MSLHRLAAISVLGILVSASITRGHGSERHFDTVINGQQAAALQNNAGGSPTFTLLLIESNTSAMLRAVEKDQPDEVLERASRFPALIEDLRRRSNGLPLPRRDHFTKTARNVEERALRIGASVGRSDPPSLRREIRELARLVRSMKRSLRDPAEAKTETDHTVP